jgi:hypothetical protein
VCRISQHYRAEITGCRSSPNGFRVSFRNEVGKAARVVDMSVGKNDRVEILDRHRKPSVLIRRILSLPLKHPTVERDRVPIYMQQVTGASDFSRRADKRDLQTVSLLLLHRAERGS